ncbi:MAG: Gfo/Idh/MocA family oxidoreductase [Actinomycetota bacterium]|nr:Gfo/Idh/MocA family oxidoreductase [Actinomycetota bacterium]
MKLLIVGLGSMGKRRIRNLQTLGYDQIYGFDTQVERRDEAASKYGIRTFADFETALAQIEPTALIISTPPDLHMHYAHIAAENGIHFFTEAGVVLDGMADLKDRLKHQKKKLVAAPSCTMRYYPGPKKIKEIVDSGVIGRPLTFTYQSGQYLPDWHPWEDYRRFYVAKKETGACKEIVPFELVWLVDIFGPINEVSGMKAKLSDLEVEIDDVEHLLMRFTGGMIGHLLVDVLARPAVRYMRLLGTEGTVVWDNDNQVVSVYTAADKTWRQHRLDAGSVEDQYINPEEPYIEEMRDFTSAIAGTGSYSYTFAEDEAILGLLYAAERSSDEKAHIMIARETGS